MRNFIMPLMLISVVTTGYGRPLPEDFKKDFVNNGMQGCLMKNRQDSLAHTTTESQKQEYCECYMRRITDFITVEDIERQMKTKSSDHLIPLAQEATSYCIEKLSKKWGYK